MPARFRIDTPAATSSPPIQLASTGLPAMVPRVFTLSAVRVGSIIAWGVKITSRPSVFGSLATTSIASTKRSGPASPSTSTGLP